VVSPIKGADFAITVAGDSMAPEFPSGAQILIKRINERAFIDWGKTYVLDTCNGTVIKKVFPAGDTGKVKCVSINPDYPPFEIDLADIYGMYRVLLCMSIK
jgi:phage repressor protein C with HTH and peptisase S24 domain